MKCWRCGNFTDQKYCPECGANVMRRKKPKQSKGVTVAKLVLGIISIVLFVLVMLQSCAVTSLGTLVSSEAAASGMFGVILAILLLAAGIVGIATRRRRTGGLVAAVIWIVGAFIGFLGVRTYADLSIWGFIALMFGAAYFLMTFISFNRKNFYKKWWFYVICLLIALALVAMAAGGAEEPEQADEANLGAAEDEAGNAAQPAYAPDEAQPEKESAPGVFDTEGFKLTYLSHSLVKDYSDKDCLDVVFEFVNYGEEPTSFDATAYCKAFQDGVQLESAYHKNEDCVEWGTQVKANTPIKVNDSFELRNTESPVELIMTRAFSFSDEKTEITLELK